MEVIDRNVKITKNIFILMSVDQRTSVLDYKVLQITPKNT